MRLGTTVLAVAIIAAAAYVAIPRVTEKSWERIAADSERMIRDLTASTIRPPQVNAPAPATSAAPELSVSLPLRREITDWNTVTGRFEPTEAVDLRARVSGYLDRVSFKDGQEVTKGDVLFVIDPRPYERALAQAQAELNQAKTRISNASLDVERARGLVERKIVSEKTFDDRENLQREAEALAKVAEERVKTAELELSYTQITAPVSGRIGRALITPGNYVSAATSSSNASTLASIVVQDPIHIFFDLTEADALRVKRMATAPGAAQSLESARVEVQLADETGFVHAGKLDFLDNRLDTGTASLRVRALLENKDRLFTPGQFARVRLRASNPYMATLVPDTAIGSDQAFRFVMVVGPDDVAVRKPVTLGPLVDGLRVVREGLEPGDWVVTRGLTRVRPGQTIRPKREVIEVSSGETPSAAPVTR